MKKLFLRTMISGALLVIGFQNCANKAFTQLSANEKTAKLETETVFPPPTENGPPQGTDNPGNNPPGDTDNPPNTPGGTIGTPGGTTGTDNPPGNTDNPPGNTDNPPGTPPGTPGGTTGTDNPPGNTDNPPGNTDNPPGTPPGTPGGTITVPGGTVVIPTPIDPPAENPLIPITYLCSDRKSDKNGSLATAQILTVELFTKSKAKACAFNSSTLRDYLLTYKVFPSQILTDNCPGLADGFYYLRVRDANKPADTNLIAGRVYSYGFGLMKMGTWQAMDPKIEFITDRNPKANSPDRSTKTVLEDIRCDRTASPLVIHLNSDVRNPKHLVLSSQEKGIMFDILGENSYNTPHTRKRISWSASKDYYYIVLPNENGQVKGIDQMFGDNTKGPDGDFALNGYHALAKYDGMSADGLRAVSKKDNLIDSRDPVFYRLRLWSDVNGDGVAQPNELVTLRARGIARIDLRFDPSYYEVDKYGNETRYKSVVQTVDGRLHLLFDLWFNYHEE